MEQNKRRTKVASGSKAHSAHDYAALAYEDYIAARLLLRTDALRQGTILAATAVEKYMKGIVALRGNSVRGHLTEALINNVKNYGPMFETISEDFVRFLKHAYEMRYTDNLPVGYSICIPQRKVLAELDYTAAAFERGFKFQRNGEAVVSGWARHLKDKFPDLCENNYLVEKCPKRDFVEAPQKVMEYRIVAELHPLEAHYASELVKLEAPFQVEAMKQTDQEGKQFKLVYIGPASY